jgi:glycogen debranching enzyme
MFALIALLIVGSPQFHDLSTGDPSIRIDSLGIKANEQTKWYSYTNKEAGFYFGETHGPNLAPYQGWTVFDNPVIKDYSTGVNGKLLNRTDSRATVFPDRLVRQYKEGVTETFTLLDSINAFLVQLETAKQSYFDFAVMCNASDLKDLSVISGKAVAIENRTVSQNAFGRWISIAGHNMRIMSLQHGSNEFTFVSPVTIHEKGREATFVVACGRSKIEAEGTALETLKKSHGLVLSRRKRMQEILDRSRMTTNEPEFDKALAWAKLSADALITNQGMKGIWAGLPWFNDYWGRDSFISLAGAALWLGDFATARQILLDFAAKQDTDTTSTNYGRIPNLITTKETIYNTADGTAWFVHGVYLYFSMTGDRDFLLRIFPTVKRAFMGTTRFHVDGDFFLTHGDQETWMDAVGPEGPYTPRGNRAVDVQSLWLRQISETRILAEFTSDKYLQRLTTEMAKRLLVNFNEKFVEKDGNALYDHLNADSSSDTTFRPNQLFALCMVTNPSTRNRILGNVVEKLAYPWGVASLYQGDPNFHPFHHDEPYYVPDAAYHNGTVWTWLTGPLVSALTSAMEQNFAFESTMFLAGEMLDGKTAGTLPELFDAFPHEGNQKPDESGAFSQAWSLGEFINSIYQDYLGVRINAAQDSIILSPRPPSRIRDVTFRLNCGRNDNYLVRYKFNNDAKTIEIDPTDSVSGTIFNVFVMLDKEKQIRAAFSLHGNNKILLEFLLDTVIAKKDGEPFRADELKAVIPHDAALDSLHFQTPQINLNWNFGKQADFLILQSSDVKRTDSGAKVFVSADDSVGDDKGPSGKYSYPLNQSFRAGILDIKHADVSYDSNEVYFHLKFQNLVNPMWHPEYGFQLTFAAIAIGDGKGGQRAVGRNSNDVLPEEREFQRIIYVGGGVEVFDNRGKKLAAYVPSPSDTANPLGNVENSEVRFSLPISLVGKPDDNWKITILVGAQDDHGGGGVGEFRTVGQKATEWQGGGKENGSMPNIYDELLLR